MIPFEVAVSITSVTHQVVGIKPRVALDHSIGAAPELVPDNDETVLQDAGDCLGWGLDFWLDTP